MTKSGFCATCGRTVYLGEVEDERCPVCSSVVTISPQVSHGTARRIGANEAMFREINEAIQDLAESGANEDAEFQCECGDEACHESIVVKRDVYDDVRRHSLRFLVRTGHEIEGAERVLAQVNGYSIVEKIGPGATVAKETDPRSS